MAYVHVVFEWSTRANSIIVVQMDPLGHCVKADMPFWVDCSPDNSLIPMPVHAPRPARSLSLAFVC